jgi:hypothetical protein
MKVGCLGFEKHDKNTKNCHMESNNLLKIKDSLVIALQVLRQY